MFAGGMCAGAARWLAPAVLIAAALASALGPAAGEVKMTTIRDKTLVVWAYPANVGQRGGSALTLDDRESHFDGVVFGEISPGRWMAGSDGFRRTQKEQESYPVESAGPEGRVQVAVVTRGNEVTLYRNGKEVARYPVPGAQSYGPESVVVFGLRHLDAGDRACFAGAIEDARVYDQALDAGRIAALEPGKASEPQPAAWWCFADGQVADRMGRFPESLLVGDVRVASGRLVLGGRESYVVAAPKGRGTAWLASRGPGQDDLVAATRAHRTRLLADRTRPAYHFVAPEGYCMPFDPNGALFWKGRYHLCFIFQDERGHCWGHASSEDLLHWRFHSPALAPNPGDPDRGIFSGNGFVSKEGEAVLLYHGVGVGNCIATSRDDDLEHWAKLPTNPIVPIPKEGDPDHGQYSSWDPHGWLEGDTYYALFGGNPATLFRSNDMRRWEYLHRMVEKDFPEVEPDEDISCPDFFPLGNKHMLLCISHKRGCRYYLGRWAGERFVPESHARMNWPGGTCFAPESLVDDRGRRIMWAWVLDRRTDAQIRESGWSGTMTLPRVLSLAADGTLRIEPPEEFSRLRYNPRHREDVALAADAELPLPEVRGDCLELSLEMEPGAARECGVKVLCSPGGEEQALVVYDAAKQCLRVDFSRSTLDPGITHRTFCMTGVENPAVTCQEAPLALKPVEPLRLRLFLDRSILEVFANERQCITQHLYPTRPDSLGVSLVSRGGAARVRRLDAWDMAPTNQW